MAKTTAAAQAAYVDCAGWFDGVLAEECIEQIEAFDCRTMPATPACEDLNCAWPD